MNSDAGALRSAIFLDRDGVITKLISDGSQAGRSPRNLDELEFEDGAAEAIQRASDQGFVVLVVTNQPMLAQGTLDNDQLNEIHSAVRQKCKGLSAIFTCPHTTSENCSCRKPKAGLLAAAAVSLSIDLSTSWMVGDRWIDVAAGQCAGCKTVLIERPYSMSANSSGAPPTVFAPTARAVSLEDAVSQIVVSVN